MLFKDHKPQFGNWTGEINTADLREYRRGNWSDVLLPMREKRWQYIGLYSEEFIIGLAVVHAGYIGTIFAYILDRKTGGFGSLSEQHPWLKASDLREDSLSPPLPIEPWMSTFGSTTIWQMESEELTFV